jgi:2-polyprenyl-3-methyl-5-hydroxy-6-metoxy-1,4-benzoquinol methylase
MNTTIEEEDVYAKETEFLNKLYTSYTLPKEAQTKAMRELTFRTFKPYLKGGIGLELGCSDGYMTEMIASAVDELHVVDASEPFVKEASSRGLKNTTFFQSLFEEFKSDTKYDYVFASYILEHVLDVSPVLKMIKSVLKPSGMLFALVPNARALSRQLALHMGLYQDLKELTENDKRHGHRRVYDRLYFNRDLEQAGFEIIHQGGIMLKILADFQMDELIGSGFLKQEHIDGLYKLGLEYPDLCGSIFAICKVKA